VAEGEIFETVPEGFAAEGEKEEEENSRNAQEGSVAEGETFEKVLLNTTITRMKTMLLCRCYAKDRR